MNWIFINKILALAGPKTRIWYSILAPGSLGVIHLLNHAPRPLDVKLPITAALISGLAICYACIYFICHLYCPEECKRVTDVDEYEKRKIARLEEREQNWQRIRAVEERVTLAIKESLKQDLAFQLQRVYDKESASEVAEGLANNAVKPSYIRQALHPVEDSENPQIPDSHAPTSQNRLALLTCNALLVIGGLCTGIALLFITVPVVRSIFRYVFS